MRRPNFYIRLLLFSFLLLLLTPVTTRAASLEELEEEQEERKSLPIQSNTIKNWPAGPEIGAQAAILMDIDTGVILYAKNIHEELYPASTTKIMTCLLAMEYGNLDDMVKFSHDAVFSVPRDGSNIGMDVGQSITLEECLYGIMVGSANEAANAAGEYVSGSIEEFVNLMNTKAAELGCSNTHFCNPNGLFDENHYTSAYDLALIARAFFQNEMLCKIGNTPRYHFEATATQPDDFYLNNKHQLITGETPYKGILGGKTGYTSEARQTLVTGCEQNGMRLVCVVLKEESPSQFTDTATLFDYGFSNFSKMNVAAEDTKYTITNDSFFDTSNDVFGSSDPFLYVDPKSYLVLPNQAMLSDTDSTVQYGTFPEENKIAEIYYTFHGTDIGKANLYTSPNAGNIYHFSPSVFDNFFVDRTEDVTSTGLIKTYFLNVHHIIIFVFVSVLSLCIIIMTVSSVRNTHFAYHFRDKKKRKR